MGKAVDFEICPVRHKKSADLVRAYLKGKKEAGRSRIDLTITLGNEEKIRIRSVKTLLQFVRKQGCWGFCHHGKNNYHEIHYWVRKNANPLALIEMLAHELAHAIGYRESMAARFGGIAAFAYKLMLDEFVEKNRV